MSYGFIPVLLGFLLLKTPLSYVQRNINKISALGSILWRHLLNRSSPFAKSMMGLDGLGIVCLFLYITYEPNQNSECVPLSGKRFSRI